MNRKHWDTSADGARWGNLRRSGMTLLELLTCLAIVIILAAVLLLALQGVRESAQTTQCSSNLRQIGIAMQLYSMDHNGSLDVLAYKGAGTSVNWLGFLRGLVTSNYDRGKGGPVYLSTPEVSACPSFYPFTNEDDTNYCYGAAQQTDDPYSQSQPRADMQSPSRQIVLSMVDEPGDYWILADSYHPGSQSQFYTIDRKHNRYGIHLRHNGMANVLFLDAHVEAADGERLKKLRHNPLVAGFDSKNQAITF